MDPELTTWMMYPSGKLVQVLSGQAWVNETLRLYPEFYAKYIFFQAYFVLSTEGI